MFHIRITHGKSLTAYAFMLIGTAFLLLFTSSSALADCSKNTLKNMRGSLELSQGRGGIWGYMEKSTALKKESMTGFQVDAKLQRLIVGYENLCADGKVPTKDVHGFLVHQLDRARGIINKSPNRTSPKKLLEEINLLNKDLSTILEKWNF